MADLEEYRRKRRPGKTPEPLEPAASESGADPVFVVQRHAARRLHYDLRLERDGVLLSWALPRGVPLRAGERALAVHVEDHPLEYADFEGDIPAGQYGAGTVELFDRGTYEVVRERADGTLTVILHGRKLQGEWALVPAGLDGEERNWLIVRAAKDTAAGPARQYEPMRPRSAKRVPSGSGWVFEIAWDGVRALVAMEGTRARLVPAGDDALDARCAPLLGRMPRALRTPECVLDGVLVTLEETIVYMVVDLLELEAVPQLEQPWSKRRKRLAALLDDSVPEVRLSRAYDDGRALRTAARAQGLGVVAKLRDSPYRSGELSDDWRLLT